MSVTRNSIYELWHKNYHNRIKKEYDNRIEKSYRIINVISDLKKNETTGLVNRSIRSVKLNLARTQLKFHFAVQRTLLKLHCLEIDFMDGLIKV